jgi:hypothetical protein
MQTMKYTYSAKEVDVTNVYPIRDENGIAIAWAKTRMAAELIVSLLNSNEDENNDNDG